MKRSTRPKTVALLGLVALAIVLVIDLPSEARGAGGHGSGGFHSGGADAHPGFVGHPGFEGRRFDGRFHGRFGFGVVPIVPFYGYDPPASGYAAPAYWYYCPSYGAYYPNVTSCPEAWVPVSAS